ncbi:MAG TPA: hypothetical protein VH415_10650 [Nitrososphaeraceae archaeon]|jgi:hypothetical protein
MKSAKGISLNSLILAVTAVLTTVTLFYSANADLSIKEPPNWQMSPQNNSTTKVWFQNSTNSVFEISKPLFPSVPFATKLFGELGLLESFDHILFGQSNFGHRYIVNINSTGGNLSSSPFKIPFQLRGPMKIMVISTQKDNEIYEFALISPLNNFDEVLNEIKPTLDSIKITKSHIDNR